MCKKRLLYLKKIVPIILFSLFCTLFPLHAQEEARITVLPFQSIEVSASVAMIISTLFETNLVNTHAYSVLSQNERDQVLAAQEASISDCTDEACAVEIGKLLAAEQIIMGTVAALGSEYIIKAKVIDVTTSKTIGADSISAAWGEELDIACQKLTLSLVAKAVPGFKAAEAEPEKEPEPEVSTEVEEEQPEEDKEAVSTEVVSTETTAEEKPEEVASAKAEEERTPGEPAKAEEAAAVEPEETASETPAQDEKPGETPPEKTEAEKTTSSTIVVIREPAAFNVPAFITMSSGILLMELGSFSNSLSFDYKQQSVDSWADYISASENIDELFGIYSNYHSSYTIFGITSYAMWGAGAAAISSSVFLFPQEAFNLSIGGKISFSAGLVFSMAGDCMALLAGSQRIVNRGLWDDYINAGENLDELYGTYQAGHTAYSVEKVLSYSLWGAGGAGMVASFLIPGEKKPIVTGFLDKLLMTAGMLLITGGNVTKTMALNSRQIAEERWDSYIQAGENLDTLYGEYDTAYRQYTLFTALSLILKASGGAAVISSVFIPFGAATAPAVREERPTPFSFQPTASGFNIKLAINP